MRVAKIEPLRSQRLSRFDARYFVMSINDTQANHIKSQKLDINFHPQSIWGEISDRDRHHTYTMELQSRSQSLFLDNSLGNTDLEVVDRHGNIAANSHRRGKRKSKK